MARIATGTRSDAHVSQIDTSHALFWHPAWFLPHTSIRLKVGGTAPFVLRDHQKKLASAIVRCRKEDKWLLHLKARQEGATTFCAGVLMQSVMFRDGITAGILGHKGADKKNSGIKNAVDMCKRFYRSIPEHQRPRLPAGLTNSLEFPDLDSAVLVEAARGEEPFRGQTLQVFLADEIAAWDNADSVWASALNAVPDEGSLVMAISTPHHYGDAMHTLCQGSLRPGSKWIYVFTPWMALAEYQSQPPRGWRASPDVVQYATKYRLTEAQAFWMESIGLVKCNYNMEKFLSEYPPDDVSCWIRTGGEFFDSHRLMEMLIATQAGEAREAPESWSVQEEAVPGVPYLVAVDPISDDARKDQLGIVVLNGRTCKVAATYQGYMEAHQSAREVNRLSLRYNGARIYVENNGVGQAILSHLKLSGGDIFSRLHGTAPRSEDSQAPMRWGWNSNHASKAVAVSALQELVRDGSVEIGCERLLRQMLGYRGAWDRGRDESGGHYDLVAAMSIAAWAYVHDRATLRAIDSKGRTTIEGWEQPEWGVEGWLPGLAQVAMQMGHPAEEVGGYWTAGGPHR